ncbi:MAG: cytochrome o ubiquinol oxidase subunit IV [Steroidobacteraceae bacterium]|jgi:cytochrome o ubiquinol oxidase subunit IV
MSEKMLDVAPGYGDEGGKHVSASLRTYLLGLALALALTGASFWAADTHFIYGPGVPAALVTLAVAQMGIHLVFFLHITTAPDNTNNVLALAFGTLIVFLVITGSLWIMTHLSHMQYPMDQVMRMQR